MDYSALVAGEPVLASHTGRVVRARGEAAPWRRGGAGALLRCFCHRIRAARGCAAGGEGAGKADGTVRTDAASGKDPAHCVRTPRARERGGKGPGTFDFLGFTMYWRRTRHGRWEMWCKTRGESLRRFNRAVAEWCRSHRHHEVQPQHAALKRRLVGHFNYFGVNGNARSMMRVRHATIRVWFKWLRRRSQRTRLTWERFGRVLERFPLPRPRVVVRIWGG